MKFISNKIHKELQGNLVYSETDQSFDWEGLESGMNIDIAINSLTMSLDNENRIFRIRGYSPNSKWLKVELPVPEGVKGELSLQDNLESGFTYRLGNKDEWIVHYCESNSWLCVGNQEYYKDTIELSNQFKIALVDGSIEAIWLNPHFKKSQSIISVIKDSFTKINDKS